MLHAGGETGTGCRPREGSSGHAATGKQDVYPREHPAGQGRLQHHHQAKGGRHHPTVQEGQLHQRAQAGTFRLQAAEDGQGQGQSVRVR